MNIKVFKSALNVLLSIRIISIIFNVFWAYNISEMWHQMSPLVKVSNFKFILISSIIAVLAHVVLIYDVNKKDQKSSWIGVWSVLFTIGLFPVFYYGLPSINDTDIFCSHNIFEVRSMCSTFVAQFYTITVLVVCHVVLIPVLWAYYIKLRNVESTRREGVVHQQQVCVAQPAPSAAGMVYQHQGVPVSHSAGIAYQQQGVPNFPPPYPTQNIKV